MAYELSIKQVLFINCRKQSVQHCMVMTLSVQHCMVMTLFNILYTTITDALL